jgi:hypothetical protein
MLIITHVLVRFLFITRVYNIYGSVNPKMGEWI